MAGASKWAHAPKDIANSCKEDWSMWNPSTSTNLQRAICQSRCQQLASAVVSHRGDTHARGTGGAGLHHGLLQHIVGVPNPVPS